MNTCEVEGCIRAHEARGLCRSHFEWSRRHGGAWPTHLIRGRDRTPLERFEEKIERLPSGHWIWTAATYTGRASFNPQYGNMQYEGRLQSAHRVAWKLFRGPIPEGAVIDHLCRVTLCVNPDHLEVTTYQINTLRGDAPTAVNAAKTHCIHGHPFSGSNLMVRKDGGRDCRTCHRERVREAQRRHRARKRVEQADELKERAAARLAIAQARDVRDAEIRARVASGESQSSVAQALGMTTSRVSQVVLGK